VPTVDLTADTLQQTIDDNEIVLLDFWADWCGPCRMFGPIYEQVSETHPDLVFAKIDTEAEQALAAQLNIQSIPTLMVVRDRVVLYSQPGALSAETLEDLVRQVRDIDMDEVRREIADQQSA